MEATEVINDILKQAPFAALLGYMLRVVWVKYEIEQDKKDKMAEALIKITQLWEDRYSKESSDDKEIKEFMKEIRDFIKELKNGK